MSTPRSEPLVWNVDIRTFSGQVLGQWTMAMAATALIVGLLLGTIFAAQGRTSALPPLLGMIAVVVACLWLFGLAIMALLFRGRSRVRYTLTERGVRCETIDPTVKKVNRLAIAVGMLTANPKVLGAGLLGRSREVEEALWRGAFRAVFRPDRWAIDLRGPWRTLFSIQCTAENYKTVAAAVAEEMRQAGTAGRVDRGRSLRAHLGRSALVLASSYALLALADEFATGILVPILVLCFAMATVWLMNLFGWVVLVGLVVEAGLILAEVAGTLHGDEPTALLFGALGAGALAWVAVGALRGRWYAALMEGYSELGI